MYTLHDFMTLTKGHEYLLSIGAVALFALFWLLLDRQKSKGREGR